jgi:hypothetical protein
LLHGSPYPTLLRLRRLCSQLDLPKPGWHFLRRGMARDLLDSGCPLSHLMRAGGWRSSSFLKYLLRTDLDSREAAEFALADSDSERD